MGVGLAKPLNPLRTPSARGSEANERTGGNCVLADSGSYEMLFSERKASTSSAEGAGAVEVLATGGAGSEAGVEGVEGVSAETASAALSLFFLLFFDLRSPSAFASAPSFASSPSTLASWPSPSSSRWRFLRSFFSLFLRSLSVSSCAPFSPAGIAVAITSSAPFCWASLSAAFFAFLSALRCCLAESCSGVRSALAMAGAVESE